MNNEKGVTLIELIVAMAIGIVLIGISFSILNIGVKSHGSAIDNYDAQADVRYAIETINNTIRYSSVGFVVTADNFAPVENTGDIDGLVKPWNYIGLSPDSTSLVHYKFVDDGSDGYYKMETLAEATDGLTYSIQFNKANPSNESKILRYILDGYRNGNQRFTQTTEVNALNAIQIIDWGDASNPAIALAYRTEETPEIDNRATGAMAMVLDTSGSMGWGINGEGTGTTNVDGSNPVRIELLKDTLKNNDTGILSILEEGETFVSLVDFDTNANQSSNQDFYKVSDDKDELIDIIDDFYADGGTNTGDGMRRAYHQLDYFNNNKDIYGLGSDQETKNYMVVLVDGVTTFASAEVYYRERSGWGYSSYYGKFKSHIIDSSDILNVEFRYDGEYQINNNISNSNNTAYTTIGDGRNLDTIYGEPYVQEIGEMVQDSGLVDQVFVIGYSNYNVGGNYPELESVGNIAESLGITVGVNESSEQFINNDYVFVASDRDSLNEAFEKIGSYVMEELWQVEGPSLN